MRRRPAVLTLTLALLASVTMLSSEPAAQRRGGAPRPPSKPTPHWPDGRVNLGPPPGENGLWTPAGIVQLSLNPKSVNRANSNSHLPNNITLEAVPFQPWARALHAARQANFERDEPHTRCKASGMQRQFLTPYGAEILEIPEIQRVFIFDIGGPHTFRTIYTDGRSHPKDLQPTYYGHSIGWWEGDTLVVDTVGYNEGFWIDRGVAPHTDQLHTVEKFTRTDFAQIRYDVTIDDPGAYTKPWGGTMNLRLEAGTELFEYVCQQQNFAHELMVGELGHVDRTTLPVP
jgi:hypothetical protein